MLRLISLLSLASSSLVASHQLPLTSSASEPSILPAPESHALLSLHRKLVEIESITENEHNVGEYLSRYLRNHNFTVETQKVSETRYNILAYGSKRDTTILVSSHIDTVPPFWKYYYNETSGIIGGRGSVDAKGSVAAQIVAVQGIREQLFDDISLLFVVGEETGGDGMRSFSSWSDRPQNDIVVFGEPTEGKLVCGHKGILSFNIKVKGKAAHSGYPWLGVSANDILVEALGELSKLRKHLPWSEKYGNTTMNLGQVAGGVAGNVVAESASAKFAVRIASGTPKHIMELVTDALADVKSGAEHLGATLDVELVSAGYGPVDIDCDLEGFETLTVNYGTDIPNLSGDHKRYLYGPGSIFVAHSDHEALKRVELEQAVLDYRRLIIAATKMHHDQRYRQVEL